MTPLRICFPFFPYQHLISSHTIPYFPSFCLSFRLRILFVISPFPSSLFRIRKPEHPHEQRVSLFFNQSNSSFTSPKAPFLSIRARRSSTLFLYLPCSPTVELQSSPQSSLTLLEIQLHYSTCLHQDMEPSVPPSQLFEQCKSSASSPSSA